MKFLKLLWRDGRVFWIFVVIFIAVFNGYGMYYQNITFRDLLPFYVLFSLIALTIISHDWKVYNKFKDDDETE